MQWDQVCKLVLQALTWQLTDNDCHRINARKEMTDKQIVMLSLPAYLFIFEQLLFENDTLLRWKRD